MSDDALPPDVTRFVLACIPTVIHLEALLLLHSRPGEELSAEVVGRRLYVETRAAMRALADLVAKGLLAASSAEGPFRFAPAAPGLGAAVDRLEETYRTRLVPLSRFIHENASARSAQDFANAFRLRKD